MQRKGRDVNFPADILQYRNDRHVIDVAIEANILRQFIVGF